MKLVTATLTTAALLAFAGASIAPAAHAQSDQQQQQDKTHPKEQQQKPNHPQEQEKEHPAQQQKPQGQEQPREQQQHQQQQAQRQQQKTQEHQQRAQQKQQEKVQKAQQKQQSRRQNASHPQSTRTQRAQHAAPARGGRPVRDNPQQTAHYEQAHFRRYQPRSGERVVTIPDRQFHANFGQAHRFSIGQTVMVGGFPRFQYGGFWFVLEEPWPGYWAYGDPDFYIVFDDGMYWLCDYQDPGVEVQLVVVTG